MEFRNMVGCLLSLMKDINKQSQETGKTLNKIKQTNKQKPIIQSEVSQKDKHQYCILTHIYEV